MSENNVVVIERVFDAPRELVWRAWTEPEHFVRWYGPQGFSVSHCDMDLRVGGSLRVCMSHAGHGEMWSAGVFEEIEPPAKLVYHEFMTDSEGNKFDPASAGMAGWPDEVRVVLAFEALNEGRTKMTLRWGVPAEMAEQSGALAGWNQAFDKLAAYVSDLAE